MREIVVVLYVMAAALPLLGLGRLFFLARREARPVTQAQAPKSGSGVSYGQVQAAMPAMVEAVMRRPQAVVWDFGFIGAGVVCGAVASIWSLYL